MSKVSRKEQILQVLAEQLESKPGERVTTAGLAAAVGVSEAALYRHFASKAKMFEGLIEFAEESVFVRINQILNEEQESRMRCGRVLYLLLGFSASNPGITRVLLGDALVGERERLMARVEKFFARLESQFKQILRESAIREEISHDPAHIEAAANMMLVLVEGRMHQFLRSRFTISPLHNWESQWLMLEKSLFENENGQLS